MKVTVAPRRWGLYFGRFSVFIRDKGLLKGPIEVRCPIHGFIALSPWEQDIVQDPVFQRLRRLRQLALTDMVYPAAMHTRFEHSIGVMHIASRMFDEVWERQTDVLKEIGFQEKTGRERDKTIIRLATLLHDVGHGPLSHAAEELMPHKSEEKRYKHEDYSTAIIRLLMKDVINNHPSNQYGAHVSADDIADFLEGKATIGLSLLFWRQLVSSQLDADRADYLLRDAYHIGVEYGKYDLNRLVVSLVVGEDETENPVLAVNEGGTHTAEALIIARYMMFSQVYLHKTRVIFDYHSLEVLRELLQQIQKDDPEIEEKDCFPPPTSEANLGKYLAWTDWRLFGLLDQGRGGPHGEIIRKREQFRRVYETGDVAKPEDVRLVQELEKRLQEVGLHPHVHSAKGSWYRSEAGDEIRVTLEPDTSHRKSTKPLSAHSRIVGQLKAAPMTKLRVYVSPAEREKAKQIVKEWTK